jgi:transglutaminase/protease-like cytokinesis protein 3
MSFGSTWTIEANKPNDNWVIVSTSDTGIITAIDVYNTYSYTCP